MRWLITVRRTCDLDQLASRVRAAGGECSADDVPIPLGDDELAVRAEGPTELARAVKTLSEVIEVFPDSEMTPYC